MVDHYYTTKSTLTKYRYSQRYKFYITSGQRALLAAEAASSPK